MTGHRDSMFQMNKAEAEAAKKSYAPTNIILGQLEIGGATRRYVYTRLLDTNLKPIMICRAIDNGVDTVKDQYTQPGWPGMKTEILTSKQLERQDIAVNKSRLPKELIPLVLDHPEIDLNDYMPAKDDPDTVVVGFTGWSRSGKSTMLAVLGYFLRDLGSGAGDIYSYDRISNGSAEQYYQVIKNNPKIQKYLKNQNSDHFNSQQLLELTTLMCDGIREGFKDNTLSEFEGGGDEWTLEKAKFGLLERFKTGRSRPQVILADMNGMRWQPDGVEQRPDHIFDILQRDGMTVARVNRNVPVEKLRIADVSPAEILSYIYDLVGNGVGGLAEADARLSATEFKSVVNCQIDPELEVCLGLYQNLLQHNEAIKQLASISDVTMLV